MGQGLRQGKGTHPSFVTGRIALLGTLRATATQRFITARFLIVRTVWMQTHTVSLAKTQAVSGSHQAATNNPTSASAGMSFIYRKNSKGWVDGCPTVWPPCDAVCSVVKGCALEWYFTWCCLSSSWAPTCVPYPYFTAHVSRPNTFGISLCVCVEQLTGVR